MQDQRTETPLLETRGLTKIFGSLRACDGIDLAIAPGEIHALLGENGAGKSTLVKMLFGVLDPSAGDILWKGKPVRIGSPGEARATGVGMVFQHFSLFDALTVAENIALAIEGNGRDRAVAQEDRITGGSRHEYGLPLNPSDSVVADLSVGQRQRVEIVRSLCCRNPAADHHGRADLGADAAGGGRPVRHPQAKLESEGCSVLYISATAWRKYGAICHHATILQAWQGGRRMRSESRRHAASARAA